MKSRVTTYVLIVAVIAVWGFVAWRIFFSRPASREAVTHRSAERETPVAEEYRLSLDYDDPFLKDAASTERAESFGRVQSSPPEPPSPPPRPEDIALKYAGTISVGGRVSYIIEHAGLLHPLDLGESLDGYILAEAFADSVRLVKEGMVFTLHRLP